jgi:hypothetical protein
MFAVLAHPEGVVRVQIGEVAPDDLIARERIAVKFFRRGRDRSGAARNAPGGLPAAGFGAALIAELAAFGRFSYDPQGSPSPGDLEARMHQLFQAGGEAFLAGLAAASEQGGWTACGAERMMVSIAGGDLRHPAYDAVMARALDFLRASGVPDNRLTGYERSWWLAHDGASQPWLAAAAAPAAAEAVITPLHRGEVRTIAQMTADAGGNVLLLTESEPPEQGYAVFIDGPRSETDVARSRTVWFTDADLHALFARVGAALQPPPFWAHPELRPYVPRPRSGS